MESGLEENVSKTLNVTGSLDQTADTDGFSISGCSSLPSSQNTSNMSKGDGQKTGDHSVCGGAVSYAGSDDKTLYHEYRVHKTQTILKQCIAQKIAFKNKYVEMSRIFLADPSQMELDQIEILNMKCTQALNGDMSDSEKSEESENEASKPVEGLLPRKPKDNRRQSVSYDNPSYHQAWMTGPGTSSSQSQAQMMPQYTTVPSQVSATCNTLPNISQLYRTTVPALGSSLFGNQTFGQNFSQNSNLMSGTFGSYAPTSALTMPPTTTSTLIKPLAMKQVTLYSKI